MKLCGTYKSDPRHRQMMDEIRFRIGDLNALFENVDQYKEKTVIIEIADLKQSNLPYPKLVSILEENLNFILDCYNLTDYITLSKKHPQRVMYHYPCTSYNDLYRIISYRPYAVTIGEPLTFDLKNVRIAVDSWYEYHVNIRVLPMIGRPTEWADMRVTDNGIKHFWIAPHLTHIYEEWVDVLDLYDLDEQREQALIEVYKSKEYMMPIGSLVKNLESVVPSNMFDDDFANRRLTCRQLCMKGISGCNYCTIFEKFAMAAKPKKKEFSFENGKII